MKKYMQRINGYKQTVVTGLFPRCMYSSFFLFICSLWLLTGCMREDYTDCPEETTLTLWFDYLNEEQQDILKDHIRQVDVVLFDRDTLFYQYLKVTTGGEEGVQEVTIPVDAGDYFVLAWGNVKEERVFSNPLGDRHLKSYLYTHEEEAAIEDLLYYAPAKTTRSFSYEPYLVEVVPGQQNSHTLSFMPAGHIIRIYIKGLEETVFPETFIQNSPGGYDFHLNPLVEQTRAYRQASVLGELDGETLQTATFYVPHFDNENTLIAGIEATGLNLYKEVSIEEYMKKFGLTVYDGGACEIPILFVYEDGVFVQVTLPGWENDPIEGGF
ncbi:MAG: FimB/Mfa2 family fimbrial subunit [Tannerellaceae bacterium]|nr:FimB/Mfa2 family fimbrial subunit [Tannerellaceae bacterium]